jgi:HEAT repeat protein
VTQSALAAILVLSFWQFSARAIEPQEFYGRTPDAWVAVLRDKDSTEDDRRRAVLALGFFGADAKAAIPDLQELVRLQRFQREAAQSLAAIDSRPEVRISQLIERFIRDGCEHLTEAGTIGYSAGARDALVRIGGPAVPALIAVLDGPDSGMRVCAAEAPGRIGPAAREAVPSLIRAIAQREVIDESEVLVRRAVVALGRIGADAKAALPILNHLFEKRLGDEYELAIAMAGIGAPPVRSLADRLVRDGDAYPAEAVLGWPCPG